MFSTIEQIRATNDKFTDEDISDAVIEDRIIEADKTIIVDLSAKYTQAELETLGASNYALNLLSTWKAAELCLSRLFGAARQVDQVSDIDYWRKKYDALIEKILNDEITLSDSTGAINKPIITSSRLKLFPTKGISGFEEGSVDDEY